MAYSKAKIEWQKKNRAKYKIQIKARHRANEVYKIQQVCSIKKCNKLGQRHHPDYSKPEEIIWLCEHHHNQVHRKYNVSCVFNDCKSKHHAKGYCKAHYSKMKRGVL